MSEHAYPDHASALVTALDQIDQIRGRFEAECAAGVRPRIEDYLDEIEPLYRSALLRGLLAADLGARRCHGERPQDGLETNLGAPGESAPTRESPAPIDDPARIATLAHGDSDLSPGGRSDDDRTPSFAVGAVTSHSQRFRVLRPHARGGLGMVYVAVDEELHREVALKQILGRHAGDAASRARFLLEAEITGGLEHPGIVPVYGLGRYADGRPYYAMRFIRGDSLKKAIAAFHINESLRRDPGRRSLELRRLLRRFIDVCNAIHYAHGRGVLHRDLKPGNIIVGKHGETLVVDWGLAKAVGGSRREAAGDEQPLQPCSASGVAETMAGAAIGTPAYMSPEQAAGDLDRLGPASDVYSLGATLYSLLTGEPPFGGDDLGSVLRDVRSGSVRPPRSLDPTIPRALEAACLKSMALEPSRRYASARGLADDLERWMADEPVEAWPESRVEKAQRWLRQHRDWARAAAAALVAVALIAIGAAVAVNQARLSEQRARGQVTRAFAAERLANARAVASLKQADANFQLAQSAVEDYLTTVSESTLLKRQDSLDLRALRKELLEVALKYYARFIKDHAGDSRLLAELASATYRVGAITSEIGSKEDALALYERSRSIRAELAAARPGDLAVLADLAKSHNSVGAVQHVTGRTSLALKSYHAARAIQERLVAAQSADSSTWGDLAKTHGNIALLERDMGKLAGAIKDHQKALDIRQKLADADPASIRPRADLQRALSAMALYQFGAGRHDEALETWQRARGILAKLAAENPTQSAFQSDLAAIDYLLGSRIELMGRPAEALGLYEEARMLQQKLAADNPTVVSFTFRLAATFHNIGSAQRGLGRGAESRRAFERAHELFAKVGAENPTVVDMQVSLAGSQNDLGALEHDAGHGEAALGWIQRALETLGRLGPAESQVAKARRVRALSHRNMATILGDLQRPAEAIGSADRAAAIGRGLVTLDPANVAYRSDLAGILTDRGVLLWHLTRPDEALTSLEEARQTFAALPIFSVEDHYLSALAHACLCMILDARRAPDATADRRTYADRAILELRSAVAGGFRDTARLGTKTAFASLQARPDFQAILRDMAFPPNPFAP